jgi:hypothetical protein
MLLALVRMSHVSRLAIPAKTRWDTFAGAIHILARRVEGEHPSSHPSPAEREAMRERLAIDVGE